MGKRKKEKVEEVSLEVEEGRSRFFACYLLTSLCPRFKGHTYIGFTVNPGRRIRQHNGEVQMGAFRTKRKRPWEMVLCIYGFPTNVSALQFEWAWQHPVESRAVRQAAALFKNLGGVANKIKLAYTMLTLPEWQSLNLTVNFFSTKYKIHSAGCPSLPEHMRVQVRALDELPCYTGNDRNEYAPDDWDNCEEYGGSREKLTEEEGSGRSTASNTCSSNRSSEENHIDWIEEPAEEHSTPHREESYILIDSPVIASSRDYLNIADKFKDRYELDDEFGDQPNKTNLNAYEDPMQTSLSHDNEVIDVFTPPCYKVSKKRRHSTASPEIIIDLTDSPIFV